MTKAFGVSESVYWRVVCIGQWLNNGVSIALVVSHIVIKVVSRLFCRTVALAHLSGGGKR